MKFTLRSLMSAVGWFAVASAISVLCSDAGGAYSLIRLRSDQGAGGGAHNQDLLGTIKVYGDRVTECDITLNAGVHYGIDQLNALENPSTAGT